jgi:hypothetical protein
VYPSDGRGHTVAVVTDQQQGGAAFDGEPSQQVEQLEAQGRVGGRHRLVRHQHLGAGCEGAGEDHALALPATEPVRPGAGEAGISAEAHVVETVGDAPALRARIADAVGAQHLADLGADAQHGVEGGGGILGHDRDLGASQSTQPCLVEPDELVTRDANRARHDPALRRQHAEEGDGEGALAAAGLAEDAGHASRRELEIEPVEGPVDRAAGSPVVDRQATDGHQRSIVGLRGWR